MKNSILYKFLKWILGGSAVSFFAILISVGLIIVSRYPDMLERADIKFCKQWKEYYNLFEKDTIPLSKIPMIATDSREYCHILIIDRTASTLSIEESKALKDSILDKELFGTSTSGNIYKFDKKNVTSINKKYKKDFEFTIQHYLMLRYYQKMACDDKIKGVIIGFFDGIPNAPAVNFYNAKLGNRLYNSTPNQNDREILITQLTNNEPLLIESNDQGSDFCKMFYEINDIIQNTDSLRGKKIILTIISDFYHDVEDLNITEKDVAIFKRENQGKISQYNFIYCIPSKTTTKKNPKENPKEKSKELIHKLFKEFEGCVNIVEISTKMFNEIKEYNQQYAFLNDVFSECLNPIIKKDTTDIIKFTYPTLNPQGIETSKAHIQLSNNNEFKWRIETLPQYADANFFISYSHSDTVEKTKIQSLPQLEFQNKTTDLYLEIETGMLNDILKKRIRLKTISEDKGNNIYGIHSLKFFEANLSDSFKDLAKTILDGLCILLILIFFSGTWLLCFYLKCTNRTWQSIFGVILILIIFCFTVYLLWPCSSNLCLWGAFVFVVISFIVNLICFIKWLKQENTIHYIIQIDPNGNISMDNNKDIDKSDALFKLVVNGDSGKLYPLRSQSSYLLRSQPRNRHYLLNNAFTVNGSGVYISSVTAAHYGRSGNVWSKTSDGSVTLI